MQNLKLTIGIPAYNEEGNIRTLIESLLSQNQDSFVLDKIIVASDGSSDQTEEIVRSYPDSRVQLIADGKRLGQAARQNQIIEQFSGDLLLLLNADVFPGDNRFTENLIKPLAKESGIGIISCKTTPLPAGNFFEKVINFSVKFREDLVAEINHGNNLYHCHGSVRIFTKDFLKNFRFPAVVSEDAYSYFTCLNAGYKFRYAADAELFYRSPQNLKDHLRQSVRFFQGQKDLTKHVSPETVKAEHKIPLGRFIFTGFRYFLKNPILFVSYGAIALTSLIKTRMKAQFATLTWEPAATSKVLISKDK